MNRDIYKCIIHLNNIYIYYTSIKLININVLYIYLIYIYILYIYWICIYIICVYIYTPISIYIYVMVTFHGHIMLNLYHIPYAGWDIPVVWLQPCHFRLTRVRMAFSHGIAQEVPGKRALQRSQYVLHFSPKHCVLAQSWVIGPNNQPSINHPSCLTYIFHLESS